MSGLCWGGVLETRSDGTETRNDVSFEDAKEVCRQASARLCTEPEISAGLTRGTGCSLDNRMVWTSTVCGDGERFCKSGRVLRFGDGDSIPAERQLPNKKVFGVRCCADEIAQTSVPATPATPTVLSQKPCITLRREEGRAFMFRQGQNRVCGASSISGLCHKSNPGVDTHTFDDAVNVCTTVGARLCTAQEVKDGLVRGTGCAMDHKMVWTSTSCGDDASLTVIGSGTGPGRCTSRADGSPSVRCCADAVVIAAAADSGAYISGGFDGSTQSTGGASASAAVVFATLGAVLLVLVAAAVVAGIRHKGAQSLP